MRQELIEKITKKVNAQEGYIFKYCEEGEKDC